LKRTPRNLVFHELIGLRVRVLRHPDPGLEGVEGRVRWETKRSLDVEVAPGKTVRVLKEGALLEFYLEDGAPVRVRGDHLLGTPAERARRIVRGR